MTIMIDENLRLDDGVVYCRHCDDVLGSAGTPLAEARVTEVDPHAAGPSVHADASQFADRAIVLRRSFCPGCLTLLKSEIVPGDEPTARRVSLEVQR